MILHLASVSHASAALGFFILSLLLLLNWKGALQGNLLVVVSVISFVWFSLLCSNSIVQFPSLTIVFLLELIRDGAWLIFLITLFVQNQRIWSVLNKELLEVILSISSLWMIILVLLIWKSYYTGFPAADFDTATLLIIFGFLSLSIIITALIEQIYRNADDNQRWAIKYLFIGIATFAFFDFVIYSNALLQQSINVYLLHARGIVNAFCVPLIAIGAARNPRWNVKIFISKRIVVYSFSFIGASLYLATMVIVSIYFGEYGGDFGKLAQIVISTAGFLLLAILIFSGRIRARIKYFFGRHFFAYKYNYRDIWLKFTKALSDQSQNSSLETNIVRAIAAIVESPRGLLFTLSLNKDYELTTDFNFSQINHFIIPSSHPLIQTLLIEERTIEISLTNQSSTSVSPVDLPQNILDIDRLWLIIPLKHHNELLGFVLMTRSRSGMSLNWEDYELLKTAGRQAASYLALARANEALSNARQFEAFNQLSAFVIHDLKNVVSQLNIIVSNAAKHQNNPEFISDAVKTVEYAVGRMNRLLNQLRKGKISRADKEHVLLKSVIIQAIEQCSDKLPIPQFTSTNDDLAVFADTDRVVDVLAHILRNSQEATHDQGEIFVDLLQEDTWAVMKITDTGCGMDAKFIRERLFRPFDTTKRGTGMGIGAFESRTYVHSLGGRMEVVSELNKGTTFIIRLPVFAV